MKQVRGLWKIGRGQWSDADDKHDEDAVAGYVILEEEGQERRFEVLEILEFTSNRKRMSVIVRSPDGKLLLFSKGADSVIKERLESAKGKDFEKTEKHLQEFSRGGVRLP